MTPQACSTATVDSDAATPVAHKSLTSNFLWTLAGNVIGAACQWATIIFLAKLGTPGLVGQFTLALAFALPVGLFANYQLRTVFVNDLEGTYTLRDIIGVRFILSGAVLLLLAGLCLSATYSTYTSALIVIMCGACLVDSLSESYYGICQRNHRMDRIACSIILRGAASLVVFAALLYTTRDLLRAATGILITKCVVLLWYDASRATFQIELANSRGWNALPDGTTLADRLRPAWNFRKQMHLAWIALPLGGLSFLNSFSANIPRFVMERFLGPRELGIFSALSYIPQAVLTIALALGFTAYAKLAALYFDGDLAAFKSLLTRVSAACVGLGIAAFLALAVLGRPLLRLLYRPEYAEYPELLLCLVAISAMACVTSCLGCALTATSRFHVQVPLAIVVTAVTAIASFVFIPRWGLYGAAFTNFLSMMLQFLGTLFLLQRALSRRAQQAFAGPERLHVVEVGVAAEP